MTKKKSNNRHRSAFILILVLIVVSGVTYGAMTFLQSMTVSRDVSQLIGAQVQARYLADSGIEATRYFLAMDSITREESGGVWNNPQLFQAVNVIPELDATRRGNYSIISPNLDETGAFAGLRYGLQNESARLNLNALVIIDKEYSGLAEAASALGEVAGLAGGDAGGSSIASMLGSSVGGTGDSSSVGRNLLMGLPGMTEDVADSILDWLDEDDEPREFGAEAEYYAQMVPPYVPANGPLQSVEQLLLVRGVTPELLFGMDQNRNGVLDPSEQSLMMGGGAMAGGMNAGAMPMAGAGGSAASTGMDTSQYEPLGWSQFFTLHSREANKQADGTDRVFVNGDDLETMYADLSTVLGNDEWASFVAAYRIAGQPSGGVAAMAGATTGNSAQTGGGGPSQPWSSAAMDGIDLAGGAKVKLNQVLDLIDATVSIGSGDQAVTYSSPFKSDPLAMVAYLPTLLDKLTTVEGPAIPGRININECPRAILLGIPGLTEEIVDQIMESRNDGSDSETRKSETWIMLEGLVTLEQMRTLTPLITAGGSVYRAQVIGYYEQAAAFSRVEVIIDAAEAVPQVAFFRRLDHLGRGFDLNTLGLRLGGMVPGM